MIRPKRYRDVLALLKGLARDARVPDAALRALLAGAESAAYTQADMQAIAALHGWELALTPSDRDEPEHFDSPAQYQAEICRLHALLRVAREQIKALERSQTMAAKHSQQRSEARRWQLDAAEVRSLDEAFAKLTIYRKALEHIVANDRAGAGWSVGVAEEALAFQPAQRPPTTGGQMEPHDPPDTTEHEASTDGMPDAVSDAPTETETHDAPAPTIDA